MTATGEYLPDEQVLVVNRSQGGRAGDIVVTPMLLADGRVLLVARGFTTFGADVAPAPSGAVEIVGRLRPSQERRRGQLSDPAEGELTEVQRLDIDRLAPQLPGAPVDMYVELIASAPAEAGPFPEPLGEPALDEGPHLSYAGQWFLFVGRRRGRLGARRAPLHQDAPRSRRHGGVASTRRRTGQGSRRSTAVIARLTSPGGASIRRYAAHVATGRSKKASKNDISSAGRKRSSTSKPWSWSSRVRRAGRGQMASHTGRGSGRPTRSAATAASASATRPAARREAATE